MTSVTASVGVAFADVKSDSEVLLRNADVAVYHAKWEGKGLIKIFNEAMYRDAIERLELKADLAQAITREELALLYCQSLLPVPR